jgi:Xaa-Pro aminopeptidase
MPSLDQNRLARFQGLLAEHGYDAYVCCTHISMGYLASFFETGGERMLVLLVRPEGEPAMIVPALTRTHASHTGVADIRSWHDGDNPAELFSDLARDWELKTAVIAVDDEIPAGYLLPMQSALPAALFKCGGDVMAKLRKRKDERELGSMRKAAKIADEALAPSLERWRGETESSIQGRIVEKMLAAGGKPTFCIVAAGASGAEPHHSTSDRPIESGDVTVIDWGCDVDKYLSDTTRTVCFGSATEEAKSVYRVVYAAHMAARDAIRPGVTCESIDRAARKVIEDAGYGEYFVHRTGHGIGMMGHEPPHIVRGSVDLLEPGQCFTVEPGIYLPGKFGVRIENIVTVTNDGHESLNAEPPAELIEIGGA